VFLFSAPPVDLPQHCIEAAVGVLLIIDERLKGQDNQLLLNCPYLSYLMAVPLFLAFHHRFIFCLVKGMPSGR